MPNQYGPNVPQPVFLVLPDGTNPYAAPGTPASEADPYPIDMTVQVNALSVADGADVAEGATTDAIVAAGAIGSLAAKLRRLTADGDTKGTLVSSAAYEASHILKNASGKLMGLIGYNSGPAQFLQLHDSATLPANAAVPVLVVAIPATSNFNISIPVTGIPFTTGIVVCNSTTGPAKTIGAADCYFTGVVMGPSV